MKSRKTWTVKQVKIKVNPLYRGSAGIPPLIRDLDTRWREVVSFVSRVNSPCYILNRWLGRSGDFREGKTLARAGYRTTRFLSCPFRSQVTTRTQNPRTGVTFHRWVQHILWDGRPRKRGSISGKCYGFFPSSKPPDRLWSSPCLLFQGHSGVFLREANTHLLLVPRFRMRGALSSLPHTSEYKHRIQ